MVLDREEHYFHILRSLGHWDKAEDLLRGTLKILGAKSPPDEVRALNAHCNLAYTCFDQRKADDAEGLIKEVLRKSEIHSKGDQTSRFVH